MTFFIDFFSFFFFFSIHNDSLLINLDKRSYKFKEKFGLCFILSLHVRLIAFSFHGSNFGLLYPYIYITLFKIFNIYIYH